MLMTKRGKDVAVKRLARQIKPQNLRDLIAEVDTMRWTYFVDETDAF
jgi:hypothetical protein